MTNEWSLPDGTVLRRMGYGAMQLPGWPLGTPAPRDTAIAVLNRAVELGVNHIDTSAFYAHQGVAANELIRAALYPYPEGLFIATKIAIVPPGFDGTPQVPLTREQIRTEVERNIDELDVDRLDLVNLRAVGMEGPSDEPIGELFGALAALREEGLIRHLGLSNVTAARLAEARAIAPVAAVQNHYNLGHRDDDALVDACAEAGVAYVPFFPLGGHVDPDLLHDGGVAAVAERHDATPSQVLLAWTLRRSPNVLLIPGTSSLRHLEQNVAAASLELTAEDVAELDTVAARGGV